MSTHFAAAVANLADLTYGNENRGRPYIGPYELRDSLCSSQYLSKQALANLICSLDHAPHRESLVVTIDACWWGPMVVHLLDHPKCPDIGRFRLIDVDPRMKAIHGAVHAGLNYVSYTMDSTSVEEHVTDIYINTSMEHLPSTFRLPKINPNGRYFLQSNNMLHAEGHINCQPSLTAFVHWVQVQGLKIDESMQIALPGDQLRFTVAAHRE